MNKILSDVYDRWVESDSYKTESAIENGNYDECKKEIVKIVGEECYSLISDSISRVACESEMSGFEKGFCYGIMFMMECVNPGTLKKAGVLNG